MILDLYERHYADAPASKSAVQRIGLAIDAAWKEIYSDLPVDKFGPVDGFWRKTNDPLGFQIYTHEVKSFAAKTITISSMERAFAENRAAMGNDHLYWIYEQLDYSQARLLGVVEWSQFKHHLKVSTKQPGNFYVWVSDLMPLLKEIKC